MLVAQERTSGWQRRKRRKSTAPSETRSRAVTKRGSHHAYVTARVLTSSMSEPTPNLSHPPPEILEELGEDEDEYEDLEVGVSLPSLTSRG
jgi:hypothetical protein